MVNGPMGGNMGTPPVPPQPPQVSFTTTAESRGGFNNFLKSIPATTNMTPPTPPMGLSPPMPMGNPMGNIDIFNQPPSMGMGMMGMNQPQMNPMMQPPMQQPNVGLQPPMMNQQPMMMADGGGVPPRRTDIMGQDHMLSYITPEEGGILQALGGSGAPGPMGIPSFFSFSDDAQATDPGSNTGGDNESNDEDDYQDYSDGSGSQDTGNVEDSYSGDYTGGGNESNDNDPFDDGGGRPEDYGLTQQDFTDASNVGASTFNESQGNRTNIVNSPNYDPQFASDSLARRGLDPSGFMSNDNFGQTTQGMQAATQAQRDAELASANQLSGQSMPTMGDLGASSGIQGAISGVQGINRPQMKPGADLALGFENLNNLASLGAAQGVLDRDIAGPDKTSYEQLSSLITQPNTRIDASSGNRPNPKGMFTGPEDALMSGRSRGASINNPGNIRGGGGFDAQIGTTPDGFAIFDNLQSGKDAIGTLANTYADKYGINTIDAFNNRFSPVGKENTQAAVDTKNKLMADALGVDLNANVDFTDPDVQGKITNAVMQSEIGKQGMQDVNAFTGIGDVFNAPTVEPDRQGPPQFNEFSRTPARTITRDGRGVESVFGELDFPGSKNDRDFNKTVVAGTNLSPGQFSRSKDFARDREGDVYSEGNFDVIPNNTEAQFDMFGNKISDIGAGIQELQNRRDGIEEFQLKDAAIPGRGRSGGGAQNIAPQNSIQNALNRAARGNRGIELGDFPQTIGPETPSGFSAIGSGFTGQTPTTDTVYDIDTRPENALGFRDTPFQFDPANYIEGFGMGVDSSPRPEDYEENVGRAFDADRMADIERLYNLNVGQKEAGKGTDPSTGERILDRVKKDFGFSIPSPLLTIADFIENSTRENMANEIALGRPMGLGETLFGYDAPNLETQTMKDYMTNTQKNVLNEAGDSETVSRRLPENQLIRNNNGRVIGIRNESGRVVSGYDPDAEIPSGDGDDPIILRKKLIEKAKEEEEEDTTPNVFGGGETTTTDPVSASPYLVESPFTSNVGNYDPVGYGGTGDLNALIARLIGGTNPKKAAKGGVIGYAGGGLISAVDNFLASV